jgi:hypothetical protein
MSRTRAHQAQPSGSTSKHVPPSQWTTCSVGPQGFQVALLQACNPKFERRWPFLLGNEYCRAPTLTLESVAGHTERTAPTYSFQREHE